MKKTIIVVGAGKGLGNHIAKKFGQNDFRVILMARNKESLEECEKELSVEGIESYSYAADAANVDTLTSSFDCIKEKFGTPDILIYNIGITTADQPGAMNSEKLMQHYQVDVASAYHCVQQIVSDDFAQKKGTIILTGGIVGIKPIGDYTPLSLDKAALRALAFILNHDLKDKGIFVGLVTVTGVITPNTHFDPKLIAESYWKMYNERNECEVLY